MTKQIEKREADPEGFNFDGSNYRPFRNEKEVYLKLSNAKASGTKVQLLVTELGDYKMVRYSLDGGQTYDLAVRDDESGMTDEKHKRLMREVEQSIGQQGKEAATFIKELLQTPEGPLVINGLRKQPHWELNDGLPYTVDANDPTRSQGPQYVMPVNVIEQLDEEGTALGTEKAPTSPIPTKAARNKSQKQRQSSNKTSSPVHDAGKHQPPQVQEPPAWRSDQAPSVPIDDDDTEEFLRQLRAGRDE